MNIEEKVKKIVARIHERITNRRNNFAIKKRENSLIALV